jgi:purine-cytosine permease-like protein
LQEDIANMIAFLFMIIVVGASLAITYYTHPEPVWLDYYKAGIIGFFLSGVILHVLNERRRKKELNKSR